MAAKKSDAEKLLEDLMLEIEPKTTTIVPETAANPQEVTEVARVEEGGPSPERKRKAQDSQKTPKKRPRQQHKKLSISLFATDLEASDRIAQTLFSHNRTIAGLSDAIKIALRYTAQKGDPAVLSRLLEDARKEDGRRKP